MSLRVGIFNDTKEKWINVFARRWCQELYQLLSHENLERLTTGKLTLQVAILKQTDAQILNKTHRKKNYATDVLSFSPIESGSLGELVICWEVIERQALENSHSKQLELGYLLLHGVLHLLGFEHENGGRAAKVMYEVQDRLFEHLSREFDPAKPVFVPGKVPKRRGLHRGIGNRVDRRKGKDRKVKSSARRTKGVSLTSPRKKKRSRNSKIA